MSRKREGLVELLSWSRRPSTCEQVGPRKDDRPHTGSAHGAANSDSSVRRLSSHPSPASRGGLPPLSRTGSLLYSPGGNVSSGPNVPDPAESLSQFQEALYVNGQPHNATSRLLRLGASSPLRRSITASATPGSGGMMPPLPTPPRTQSACPSASGAAASPEPPNLLLAAAPSFLDSPNFRLLQQQPQQQPQQQACQQPGGSGVRPFTAWTGGSMNGGSPPRSMSVQRFGSRENGAALLEEARRKAQEAMEVLCGDQEISAETRAQATAALQELEAVLGPREMGMTALVAAARNLRADLCRELHNTEKQTGFARAQLKSLERQHDRLRQQLRSRPDPIVLPPPTVAGLSDTGTPSISPKHASVQHFATFDILQLQPNGSGSLSAPHSPMGIHARPRLESVSPLPPRPGYYAAASAAMAAAGGVGGDGNQDSGGAAVARRGSSAAAAVTTPSAPLSSMSFADRASGGGAESVNCGVVVLSDKWSLAGAMERTLQMRALSRVEAALQAVAAEAAAAVRPRSGGRGGDEVVPPLDVDELRRLKHSPQGMADMPEAPSYLGFNVRRTPSPGPGDGPLGGLPGGSFTFAQGGGGGGGGGGGAFAGSPGAADPRATLQWSNRGISTAKMPQLKEALVGTPQLVRLCLAGNKLSNEDVAELMSILSEPASPRIQELLLDQNTSLSWRCALPLALALGMSPDMAASAAAADWAAVAAALAPPSSSTNPAALPTTPAALLAPAAVPSARDKIHRLAELRLLSLAGVKLGDKGVAQLAEGLRANNSLRVLDLRRCGISDAGGAVLLDVLESNGRLSRLDVSWNALRAESARVLEGALAGNAGLRELSLAHNGFGDLDGAKIIKGLLNHGRWLHVDLSHNTLGPGSCMMVGELLRRLGAAATSLMAQGTYAEAWAPRGGGQGQLAGVPSGMVGDVGPPPATPGAPLPLTPISPLTPATPGGRMGLSDPSMRRANALPDDRSGSPSPTTIRISAGQLGSQLHLGQPCLALDANPLGSTGLRIILDAMEAMSQSLMAAAGLDLPHPEELGMGMGDPQQPFVPPLPLHVTISACNVAPPSDRSGGAESGEEANPFLPSIAVLCRHMGGDGRGAGGGGKDGGAAKKAAAAGSGSAPTGGKASSGKDGRPRSSVPAKGSPAHSSATAVSHAVLTLQSPHLDLQSPAGVYSLDVAHPATAVLVAYLLRLRERLTAAAAAGLVGSGVAVAIQGISLNGRPMKLDQLAAGIDNWSEGTLQLTVKAPAVLALEPPLPLTPLVASWLAGLLADPTVSPLWKLSVVQAAGSVCFFTPGQCLALLAGFDRDTQSTETVAAAQMLYARSAQPLAFWENVLPRMPPSQQASLRERVGDLVALDMNRPMGRYNLNLSRQVDRFVALRLQLASALESSWLENKYYINWLNASFNGQPLDRPGLTHIRDYTMPGAGVLRLDYVSYPKPGLGLAPADPEELALLLSRLRDCNVAHINALLQVRAQVCPPPPPPPKQDRMRSPIGRRKQPPGPPPPPKPRLSAFRLTHISLLAVARFLAHPGPPPPPPPGVDPATAPPPPLPTPWARAAGLDPEPLFRRVGVAPPDLSTAGYSIPPPSVGGTAPAGAGTVDFAAATEAAVTRAASLAAKSAKSAGGRSSMYSLGTSRGAARRRSVREKGDEEEWQPTQADYHAALLLMVHQARDLPLLASKMGPSHLAAAVAVLLRLDGAGVRAVAALLAALPPLAAARFLYDQVDPSPCLLPPEARRQVAAAMPAERLRLAEAAARGASEAALARSRGVRTELNAWASQRFVSSEQVSSVLSALHTEGDRVAAMVVLWPRLVDGRWKRAYMRLKLSEQRQVMMRLGFWHVYTCLADPHGISFSLDLGEPEQRDIARELVRMAVKETMRAKQEMRARGAGMHAATAQTLLDLHGNGNPVHIPEDEKLWGMADSNFKTMDFMYCPSFEQSLERVQASATHIQRFWAAARAKRAAARARELGEDVEAQGRAGAQG